MDGSGLIFSSLPALVSPSPSPCHQVTAPLSSHPARDYPSSYPERTHVKRMTESSRLSMNERTTKTHGTDGNGIS
jgi:hypothetical protein